MIHQSNNKITNFFYISRNIFVTERNNLKIGDLGFSINKEEFLSSSRIIGTLNYMSPEILKNEPYDTKIDTW